MKKRWSLNYFSEQRSTHGETYVCVKNISELSAWRRFRKSIFCFSMRGFPEDNESNCHHTHKKRVLVLATSAVFHMVFPIDSASMLMTQPWSMCLYQYFSLSICQPLYSSLNQTDMLVFVFVLNILTIYFSWVNTKNEIYIGTYAYRSACICSPICRQNTY